MAETLPLSATLQSRTAERVSAKTLSIPWYIWCNVLAVASSVVGGVWDISWQESVGRDTFWTPAHLLIQLCGILSGFGCGYLILSTSFRKDAPLRANSVSVWGFRGPLGAFICAWGGVAMIASAPFDDWWHNAYGLDVRIVSPPHMVLAAGFFGIEFGTTMLLLAFMNRARDDERPALQRLFLYVGGTAVCESLLLKLEYIARPDMHSAFFYIVVSLGTLGILTAVAIASRQRWACTIMAAVYTGFGVAFLWIFPLFPAQPKLGPVYRQISHFIPWEFPLLVIVPAFAIDLILQRTTTWRPVLRAMAAGVAFLGVFIAAQWPFASFLMTPLARNWVFGTDYMDFSTPARSLYARFLFIPPEAALQFWRGMFVATITSCVMVWLGIHTGRAMQKVRR